MFYSRAAKEPFEVNDTITYGSFGDLQVPTCKESSARDLWTYWMFSDAKSVLLVKGGEIQMIKRYYQQY